MKIIITDITHMRGDKICTAGWSEEEGKMLRPLLPNNVNWDLRYVGPEYLQIGRVLEFTCAGNIIGASYPHATEDRNITNDTPTLIEDIPLKDLRSRLGGLCHTARAALSFSVAVAAMLKDFSGLLNSSPLMTFSIGFVECVIANSDTLVDKATL